MITPREFDHAIPKMRNSYNEKLQEIPTMRNYNDEKLVSHNISESATCNIIQVQLMCHQRFSFFFSGQGPIFTSPGLVA